MFPNFLVSFFSFLVSFSFSLFFHSFFLLFANPCLLSSCHSHLTSPPFPLSPSPLGRNSSSVRPRPIHSHNSLSPHSFFTLTHSHLGSFERTPHPPVFTGTQISPLFLAVRYITILMPELFKPDWEGIHRLSILATPLLSPLPHCTLKLIQEQNQ